MAKIHPFGHFFRNKEVSVTIVAMALVGLLFVSVAVAESVITHTYTGTQAYTDTHTPTHSHTLSSTQWYLQR